MRKLITVLTAGPLPELNHITGPVLHPWYVEEKALLRLVGNKRKVYEHNPEDRSEKILLNLKNVSTVNFGETKGLPTTAKKVEPKVQPVVEPTPVVVEEVAEVVVEEVVGEVPVVEQPKPKHNGNDFKKKK